MPTKDTKDNKDNDVLRQVVAAALKLPGDIAGGGVDLSNMVLGLLTGKGLDGFVDTPVGGSKQINDLAGLSEERGGLTEESLSAILGLISPGGAAKTAAAGIGTAALLAKMATTGGGRKEVPASASSQKGVIGPAKEVLGLSFKEHNRIKQALAQGYDRNRMMREEGVFNYGAIDDSLRANVSDELASINQLSGLIRPSQYVPDTVALRPGANLGLEEVLSHPELFKVFPDLKNVRVKPEFWGAGGGGFYDPSNNLIGLEPPNVAGSPTTGEQLDSLLDVLLHETTHSLQNLTGLASGGSPWGRLGNSDEIAKAKGTLTRQHTDELAKGKGARDVRKVNNIEQWLDKIGEAEIESFRRYRGITGELDASATELYRRDAGFLDYHPLDALQLAKDPSSIVDFTGPNARIGKNTDPTVWDNDAVLRTIVNLVNRQNP